MSRSGRKLSPQEAALWARVARTVAPLDGKKPPFVPDMAPPSRAEARQELPEPVKPVRQGAPSGRITTPQPPRAHVLDAHGLDRGWDRKLARGLAEPDFSLDLHGCTLDAAHGRLLHGLTQAKAMGARMVLLVTGKPRPADPADRTSRRGAIRAKVIDWLAASDHAADIAAIRGAHRRHGGQGALYIILKRRRG